TEHHNTVVIGGVGQGREGKGHDAFAGVPYDSLNKIGMRDVKMSDSGASLTADLAAAYEPSVGVVGFVRRFSFKAPGEFLIEDSIKTDRPQIVTSYLHSDSSIVENNGGFEFEGAQLFAEFLEPKSYDSAIGPNFLTAPGRPGSVDKGEREQRGVRLAISTKEPVKDVSFKVRLRVRQ
ncbi:MAG TPA: hypothetical protein VMZ26_02715, partial [Pyrinomonadaceae bacterium]|nr:hypothetical protein [Pyrinomonadaceae bacterium]